MDFVDGTRNYISAAVQDEVIGVAEAHVRRLRDIIYNERYRTQRGIVTGVVDQLVGMNEEELTQIVQVLTPSMPLIHMRALNIAELRLFCLTVERLDDVHTANQITEEQYAFCRHPAAGMILKLSGMVRLNATNEELAHQIRVLLRHDPFYQGN
jgi:hypothetical protein